MTEQSRIITEEQWQEYIKLKEQLEEANELLESLLPIDRWQDNAAVIDYLHKWSEK